MLTDILNLNYSDDILLNVLGVNRESYNLLRRFYKEGKNPDRNLVLVLFFLKYRPPLKYLARWAGVQQIKTRDLPTWSLQLKTILSTLAKDYQQKGQALPQCLSTLVNHFNTPQIDNYLMGEWEYSANNFSYTEFIAQFPEPLKDSIRKLLPNPNVASSPAPLTPVSSTLSPSTTTVYSPQGPRTTPITLNILPRPNKKYILYGKNLDLKYSRKPRLNASRRPLFIEGNHAHTTLAHHEQTIRFALQATVLTPSSNLAVAKLGFIVSKYPLAVRDAAQSEHFDLEFISVDISVKNNGNFKAHHSSTGIHDEDALAVKNLLLKNASGLLGTVTFKKTELNPASDLHSELALYTYLNNPQAIKMLVTQLLDRLPTAYGSGYRVYGVVLDIHSTLSLCKDCAPLTLGMSQSNREGFLRILKNELKARGFAKAEEEHTFKMVTRYSYDNATAKPSEDYCELLTQVEDAELKDVKELFKRKAVLHSSQKTASLVDFPQVPRLTLFHSGTLREERALPISPIIPPPPPNPNEEELNTLTGGTHTLHIT